MLVAGLRKGLIDGAIVTRMDPSSPLQPLSYLATSEEEIAAAMGSKYCPVAANLSLSEVLSTEGEFAVVGLPCHIQGLRKAQERIPRLKRRVAICISIFCGLNMSPLGTRVALRRKKIAIDQVVELKYRGAGWPGYLQVWQKDGVRHTEPYFEYFHPHFSCYEMHRCYLCSDALGELSDLSCGDAWLPEYKASDDQGTSILIVRSEAGRAFMASVAAEALSLQPLSAEKAAQSQWKAIMWKKEWLGAKKVYSKLAGQATPHYEQELPKSRPRDYSGAGWQIASRYLYRLWHRVCGLQREI
jgi:coenzyme F420 hydrogenase subunit beta